MNKSLSEYLGYEKHQTRKSQNGARDIVPKKMLKIWETLIENWFTIEKNNEKLTALLCLKNKSAVDFRGKYAK